MFKKLIIAALIMIGIGAVSVSAYNTTLARAGQTGPQQVPNSQSAQVNTTLNERGATAAETNPDNQSSTVEGENLSQQPVQQNPASSSNAELANLPPATPGDLSEAEKAALEYMREEEKLAHDVYITLNEIWGLNTFQNIANSEQSHTESVMFLLDRYGLEDIASSDVGKFTNPDLQALYNKLIERGSQSLAEAIKVGGAIEEIDILDLQEHLAQTDNADIQRVFNNLLRGSGNHLKAFVNALKNQVGEVYQPQYMTQEAFQAILASVAGGGFGRGGQGGAGRNTTGQGGSGGGYRGGNP